MSIQPPSLNTCPFCSSEEIATKSLPFDQEIRVVKCDNCKNIIEERRNHILPRLTKFTSSQSLNLVTDDLIQKYPFKGVHLEGDPHPGDSFITAFSPLSLDEQFTLSSTSTSISGKLAQLQQILFTATSTSLTSLMGAPTKPSTQIFSPPEIKSEQSLEHNLSFPELNLFPSSNNYSPVSSSISSQSPIPLVSPAISLTTPTEKSLQSPQYTSSLQSLPHTPSLNPEIRSKELEALTDLLQGYFHLIDLIEKLQLNSHPQISLLSFKLFSSIYHKLSSSQNFSDIELLATASLVYVLKSQKSLKTISDVASISSIPSSEIQQTIKLISEKLGVDSKSSNNMINPLAANVHQSFSSLNPSLSSNNSPNYLTNLNPILTKSLSGSKITNSIPKNDSWAFKKSLSETDCINERKTTPPIGGGENKSFDGQKAGDNKSNINSISYSQVHLHHSNPSFTLSGQIQKYCSDLGLLSTNIPSLSSYICSQTLSSNLCSRRNPSSICSASIYLACVLEEEGKTQSSISQVGNVTEVTLRKVYKELAQNLSIVIPPSYIPLLSYEKAPALLKDFIRSRQEPDIKQVSDTPQNITLQASEPLNPQNFEFTTTTTTSGTEPITLPTNEYLTSPQQEPQSSTEFNQNNFVSESEIDLIDALSPEFIFSNTNDQSIVRYLSPNTDIGGLSPASPQPTPTLLSPSNYSINSPRPDQPSSNKQLQFRSFRKKTSQTKGTSKGCLPFVNSFGQLVSPTVSSPSSPLP